MAKNNNIVIDERTLVAIENAIADLNKSMGLTISTICDVSACILLQREKNIRLSHKEPKLFKDLG